MKFSVICFRLSRVMALALCALLLVAAPAHAQTDPLPSWNDGQTKQAIIQFVKDATDKSSPKYVAPEDRIATFDNDGTLWVEHPLYTQAIFALDRVKALAPEHPEWKTTEPFKSVLADDKAAMAKFGEQDWAHIIAATHAGMTIEAFLGIAKEWLTTAKHPRFQRPVHRTRLPAHA